MSDRLGIAMVEHIRSMRGESKFVLLEGVPEDVAVSMTRTWRGERLPALAVASSSRHRFGRYALSGVSGTALRNRHPEGVCLVVCEGVSLPDRQSVKRFENVAPSDLLENVERLVVLARAGRDALLDGPARAVRQAILTAPAGEKPSALAVSRYFDAIAEGADPLEALPILGGFADHARGGTVDAARIAENLRLASRRRSDDVIGPTASAAARRRAQRIIARRPGVSRRQAADVAAEVITFLQSGDDRLLEALTFDEASEILGASAPDLAAEVELQLADFRRTIEGDRDAEVPWDQYRGRARALRRPEERKEAARDLVDLDDIEGRAVFQASTRKKLERLLKDAVIRAGSCPEYAILQVVHQLDGCIERIQLLNPDPPAPDARTRAAAQRALVLACARIRLGGLFRWLTDSHSIEIDGLLLRSAGDGLWPEAFEDADLRLRKLPAVELRVHGAQERATISWTPDLDDLGLLRSAFALTEAPCLALETACLPDLASFCSGGPPKPRPIASQLRGLADRLRSTAASVLADGLSADVLSRWVASWERAVERERAANRADYVQELALVGSVEGAEAIGLTAFAPLKSEWVTAYLQDLWGLIDAVIRAGASDSAPTEATAAAVARLTASHYPAFVQTPSSDRPLLPSAEARIWSVYGARARADDGGYSAEALGSVLERLLSLQPEAAGHLRCLAWGPGAADLVIANAVHLLVGGQGSVREVELFCAQHRPSDDVLAEADETLARAGRELLRIRYLDSLDSAADVLGRGGESAVHLAVATGLTDGGARLEVNIAEVTEPELDDEVLFAPRTWLRPGRSQRTLLMPPGASDAFLAWLRLATAIDDGWSDPGSTIRVPELRTGTRTIRRQLQQLHDLALWVATIDRYATRDSLEDALEDVAILHQERRLSGESPTSLVISQKSGGPADRAVGRSLRAAGIVPGEVAFDYGIRIRRVASQGYGILALEAATTGAGINELIGHVVAFSLLGATSTPWPLPAGCRVLLLSLDDHAAWFLGGKRADLVALAIDTREVGIHAAVIEVKARRSDPQPAGTQALDQLRKTLVATRWAAYPDRGSVHSRLWLNRLAEAAYAVVRESRFRLDADEIRAIEEFRRGSGTLEWAGLGLVFGPDIAEARRDYPMPINGDRVPIVIHAIRLTEPVVAAACNTSLGEMYTVEASRAPLMGGRTRRRPERGDGRVRRRPSEPGLEPEAEPDEEVPSAEGESPERATERGGDRVLRPVPSDEGASGGFVPPILGWDLGTGEQLRWEAAGERGADLGNGHVEIWGSSGMGKTQFTMSLLGQLAHHTGTRFAIADFKNDYSSESNDFPSVVGAQFIDLWNEGAPFNPLALRDVDQRTVESAQIELRDAVDVAARSFTRMGHRQLNKFRQVLHEAYEIGRREERWPTMMTVNDLLDDDLSGVIGDLTRNQIFRDGPPLGDIVDANVIFGLSQIPGNGLTTVLAAGFILSALLLKIQSMPPVANTIRYALVVDEAHRVADFKALDTLVREGRSKGLAVILATQQPSDLPEVVATNAATKICFRLPDATMSAAAARRLDPSDPTLPEQLRTLGVGEAFVRLGGEMPRLLSMCQMHRDAEDLGIARHSES
jgi:hypothetical protein